jgi:hypothetical protein
MGTRDAGGDGGAGVDYKLNGELSSLNGQLEAAEQARDSYQELVRRVPTLEEQLAASEQEKADLVASRAAVLEDNANLSKTIESERKSCEAENQKLADNAPYALVQCVMRIVRGGVK